MIWNESIYIRYFRRQAVPVPKEVLRSCNVIVVRSQLAVGPLAAPILLRLPRLEVLVRPRIGVVRRAAAEARRIGQGGGIRAAILIHVHAIHVAAGIDLDEGSQGAMILTQLGAEQARFRVQAVTGVADRVLAGIGPLDFAPGRRVGDMGLSVGIVIVPLDHVAGGRIDQRGRVPVGVLREEKRFFKAVSGIAVRVTGTGSADSSAGLTVRVRSNVPPGARRQHQKSNHKGSVA